MNESQVGYLCKAAASLPNAPNSRPLTLLKSYYLMKCKEITNGYGLPDKLFSSKARCSRCCTEWKRGTKITVQSNKLSKKQRQRIRSLQTKENKTHYEKSRLELLHSKKMEQLCDFCKQNTVTNVPKPEKIPKEVNTKTVKEKLPLVASKKDKSVAGTKGSSNNKTQSKQKNVQKKTNEINVYSSAKDVYSLTQKNNTLSTSVKETAKAIKNNRKKKDKFAGLFAKAVLASAKIKEEKEKQKSNNKLSLFLKPSDGK